MRHMWGNEIGRGVTIRTARKQHQQDNQLKDSHFMCGSGKFSQAGEGGGRWTRQIQTHDIRGGRAPDTRSPPPLDTRMHLVLFLF